MEDPRKILENPEILRKFKFLEIEPKNGGPKIRGQISSISDQSTTENGDLLLSLDFCAQQCLGWEDWVAPDQPLSQLRFIFAYERFTWLGLTACPILIVIDDSGREFLFFKEEDEYVKTNRGFKA